MNKKILIAAIAVIAILMVLFVPNILLAIIKGYQHGVISGMTKISSTEFEYTISPYEGYCDNPGNPYGTTVLYKTEPFYVKNVVFNLEDCLKIGGSNFGDNGCYIDHFPTSTATIISSGLWCGPHCKVEIQILEWSSFYMWYNIPGSQFQTCLQSFWTGDTNGWRLSGTVRISISACIEGAWKNEPYCQDDDVYDYKCVGGQWIPQIKTDCGAGTVCQYV